MKIDWKGWLGWVAVTMVGVELVMLIIFWKLVSPPSSLGAWLESPEIIGLVGTVFGTLQWIWLSHRMSKAGWWIPATVVGWYLAVGFNILGEWHAVSGIVQRLGRFGETLRACSFPVALTLPQWLLLQQQFRRAGYWIVAQLIAWLTGLGLVVLAEDLNVIGPGFLGEPSRIFGWRGPDLLVWTAMAVLFGLGFCSVTWVAIVWILRNLKSPSPNEGV